MQTSNIQCHIGLTSFMNTNPPAKMICHTISSDVNSSDNCGNEKKKTISSVVKVLRKKIAQKDFRIRKLVCINATCNNERHLMSRLFVCLCVRTCQAALKK